MNSNSKSLIKIKHFYYNYFFGKHTSISDDYLQLFKHLTSNKQLFNSY